MRAEGKRGFTLAAKYAMDRSGFSDEKCPGTNGRVDETLILEEEA